MNDDVRKPYQSSWGHELYQYFIYALANVLMTDHRLAQSINADDIDLDSGTFPIEVTLKKIETAQSECLPKIVQIDYVESLNGDDAIVPSQLSITDQLFQSFMEAVERVASILNQESTTVQPTGVDLETRKLSMKVVLKDIDAARKENLPRIVEIEYVTKE